ncbi:SemiSWEET transporter [Nanoarchaeota archaeon]
MDIATIIGTFAAILATSAFLPQVIKTWKTKKTRDISLVMYIVFCTGVFLWMVYGIMIMAWPLIIANIITFSLAFTVLILKIRYR